MFTNFLKLIMFLVHFGIHKNTVFDVPDLQNVLGIHQEQYFRHFMNFAGPLTSILIRPQAKKNVCPTITVLHG